MYTIIIIVDGVPVAFNFLSLIFQFSRKEHFDFRPKSKQHL